MDTIKDVVQFDSAFSEDEQKELWDEINKAANAGLVQVSPDEAKKELKAEAKKKGFLMPLLVNSVALVVLAGGALLLIHYQQTASVDIRESSGYVGVTERKLIDEIRSETQAELDAKDSEITAMQQRLASVNSEYHNLRSKAEQDLSETEKQYLAQLESQQAEFEDNLNNLKSDRAKILEDSRSREAGLRASLESSLAEARGQAAQNLSDLTSAQQELAALQKDGSEASRIDSQMAGFLQSVQNSIAALKFDDAAAALAQARSFMNTPGFQGNRQFVSRKPVYEAALSGLQSAVDEGKKLEASGAVDALEKNDALQSQLAAAQAAAGDSAAAQAQAAAEAEAQRKAAEDARKVAEQAAADGASLQQQLDATKQQLAAVQTQLSTAEKDLTTQQAKVTDLQSQVATRQATIDSLNNRVTTLQSQQQTAQKEAQSKDTEIQEKETQISDLNTKLSDIVSRLPADAGDVGANQLNAIFEEIRQLLATPAAE
jgi:chromosome segregation ATPase